jgi:hypothetical protein
VTRKPGRASSRPGAAPKLRQVVATLSAAQITGWRTTYLLLAGILLLALTPLHWWGLDQPCTPIGHLQGGDERSAVEPVRNARAVTGSRPFVLLAAGTAPITLATYAVVVNLIPALVDAGMSPATAALALGLGGVGQVSARLGYARFTTTPHRPAGSSSSAPPPPPAPSHSPGAARTADVRTSARPRGTWQLRTFDWSEVRALIPECMSSLSARWFVKVESYSCIGVRTAAHTRTCGICPVDTLRVASQNCARSRGRCTRNLAYR